MYQHRPNLHSLMTDAGEDIRAVANNYPALIHCDVTGCYYKLVSWDIRRTCFPGRWHTLSQWEAVSGLYENMPDGLGTM